MKWLDHRQNMDEATYCRKMITSMLWVLGIVVGLLLVMILIAYRVI